MCCALIFATQRQLTRNRFQYGLFYYILTCLIIWPGFVTTLRAQVFTYFFFSLWIFILERIRKNRCGPAWLLPVTMVVWTNVHGGFVVGLGLVVLYIAGELLNGRRPYPFMGNTGGDIRVNPHQIRMESITGITSSKPRPWTGRISWNGSPIIRLDGGRIRLRSCCFFLIMTGAVLLRPLKFYQEIDWVKVIIVLVTLFLTLKHTRHLVFWGISVSIFCYDAYIRLMNVFSGYTYAAISKIVPPRMLSIGNVTIYATVYFLVLAFLLTQTIGNSHADKCSGNTNIR